MDIRTFVEMIVCVLLPVFATVTFAYVEKDNKLEDSLKFKIIVGVVFGILASLGTELGIKSVGGSVINTRNAEALCAGLVFGFPCGVVAGLIGCVERIISAFVFKTTGTYTVWACAITTLLAGAAAGLLKKTVFKQNIPYVFIVCVIGIVAEIVHAALVVLFKVYEFEKVIKVIEGNLVPSILYNTIPIVFAVYFVKQLQKVRKV